MESFRESQDPYPTYDHVTNEAAYRGQEDSVDPKTSSSMASRPEYFFPASFDPTISGSSAESVGQN